MCYCVPIEFSLNVFIEFAEFGDKNVCHYSKRAQTCHTATSCVRDHSATTVPVRHMWEAGSLNYAQFMLQWFAEFSEFLFHLGKTPISASSWAEKSGRMKPAWNTFNKKHFQFVQNGTVMRAFLKGSVGNEKSGGLLKKLQSHKSLYERTDNQYQNA